MQLKKLLLAASAAFALALPQLAQNQTVTVDDSGSSVAAFSADGPAAGRWETPGLLEPGHLRGKLFGPRGDDVFRIVARIERNPQHLHAGRIVGKAVLLEGPQAGTELPLVGRWHATGEGQGRFHAHVFGPGQGTEHRRPLLEVGGRYRDSRPARPGFFEGRWGVID